MEIPVWLQSWQFALAVAAGLGLAALYDIFRGLRHTWRFFTVPLDTAFCLAAFLTLMAWSIYVGRGRFRLFLLPGAALGAMTWFLTLSPMFLALWLKILAAFRRCLRLVVSPFGKIYEKAKFFCKNIFSIPNVSSEKEDFQLTLA